MGIRHSKKIKIINLLPEIYAEFPHLEVCDKIFIRKGTDFDIPGFELKSDGYFPALVRLWPSDRDNMPDSPNVSSLDSGIDMVH